MYDKEDEETQEFKDFFTQSYTKDVIVGNQPSTTISMIGIGAKQNLQRWDFYFKWNETTETGKFYRVPDVKQKRSPDYLT